MHDDENYVSCVVRPHESCKCGLGLVGFEEGDNVTRCCSKDGALNTCVEVPPEDFDACNTWFCTFEWSAWSACNASCASYGYRKREGGCFFGYPTSTETETCFGGSATTWAPWTEWNACNVSCGTGHEHRTRSCLGDCYSSCPINATETELRPCERFEPTAWQAWSPWSTCGECSHSSSRSRGRKCVGDCAADDGCAPESFGVEQETCTSTGTWAFWGPWGPCSVACGDGIQARTAVCVGEWDR